MKNTEPMVSIIIPTYNRAGFIARAIDSALAQTYTDYEIIVVDDGSTDNTKEVLKPYENKIQYIYEENSGSSAARNTGIRAAKGKWLAFLDSDDEWLPKKLDIQMKSLISNSELVAHTANAAYSPPRYQRIKSTFEDCKFPLKQRSGILKNSFIWILKYAGLAISTNVVCQKKAALAAGLFDGSFAPAEDYEFLCRLAIGKSWGFCWDELAIMHCEPEITDKLTRLYIEDPVRAYSVKKKIYEEFLKNPKINKSELGEISFLLSNVLHKVGMYYLRQAENERAKEMLTRSLSISFSIKSYLAAFLSRCPGQITKRIMSIWLYFKRIIATNR
jgi:glycosyltransferase involved in cell wall biosynthesis